MGTLIITHAPTNPKTPKEVAEECCAFVNELVGYQAATPDFCRVHRRYTGNVRITRHGMRNLIGSVFLGAATEYAELLRAEAERPFVHRVWTP